MAMGDPFWGRTEKCYIHSRDRLASRQTRIPLRASRLIRRAHMRGANVSGFREPQD